MQKETQRHGEKRGNISFDPSLFVFLRVSFSSFCWVSTSDSSYTGKIFNIKFRKFDFMIIVIQDNLSKHSGSSPKCPDLRRKADLVSIKFATPLKGILARF